MSAALRTNLARWHGHVVDLLQAWDEDYLGTVDFPGFLRALSVMGVAVDPLGAKTLFGEFEAIAAERPTYDD